VPAASPLPLPLLLPLSCSRVAALETMRSESDNALERDLERNSKHDSQLDNNSVQSFAWEDVAVTVRDRKTKSQKKILSKVDGCVKAG
jgi:hypothetical protein